MAIDAASTTIPMKSPPEQPSTENAVQPEATLILPDGRSIQLSVMFPSMGDEMLIDVRDLHNKYKVLTFDPGFNSTASCRSAITYVDGDKGLCLYRGHAVHDLVAKNVPYTDVAYLLLYGKLPGAVARSAFLKQLKDEMLIHEQIKVFVQTFIHGSHPMSILASVVSAMASFYTDPMSGDHLKNFEQRELACVRLIAKMPSIVAMIFKTKLGLPIVYPRADLSYAENFLTMMFGTPIEPYKINPLHARVIDALLVIHADHEQNASTSTVRTAGSSLANPYACIAAGVTSLWGRAHGGANEAVIKMLTEIGHVDKVEKFIDEVKTQTVRLMGFGHRIYRNYDPRATVMRQLYYELFASSGKSDPLFDIAMKLEKIALEDDYFQKRKLYPNVDFYSGMVMRCLNIPSEMFTVMFALGRCAGWLAHWKEMIEEKQLKISRPRQLYLGKSRIYYDKVTDDSRPATDDGRQATDTEHEVDDVAEEVHQMSTTCDPFHAVQAKMLKQRQRHWSQLDAFEFDVWGEYSLKRTQPPADFSTV